MHPYTAPQFNVEAFHCPHCNAFAKQEWFKSSLYEMIPSHGHQNPHQHAFKGIVKGFHIATCSHCHKPSYWLNDKMIYPNQVVAPMPNQDLSEEIKKDFE